MQKQSGLYKQALFLEGERRLSGLLRSLFAILPILGVVCLFMRLSFLLSLYSCLTVHRRRGSKILKKHRKEPHYEELLR